MRADIPQPKGRTELGLSLRTLMFDRVLTTSLCFICEYVLCKIVIMAIFESPGEGVL